MPGHGSESLSRITLPGHGNESLNRITLPGHGNSNHIIGVMFVSVYPTVPIHSTLSGLPAVCLVNYFNSHGQNASVYHFF